MPCRFDDVGVMISLVSEPQNRKTNFQKGINKSFENYKKSMEQNITFENLNNVNHDWIKYLYKPYLYYIFGEFDTAIISFTDDFDFNVRSFRPFDPILDSRLNKNHFNHKVIIGPTPNFDENKNILYQANNSFDPDDLPYIAITQIKLNNNLLINTGTIFMRCYIKSILRLYQNKYKEKYKPFKILIIESFAWAEVTILIFSNSFNKIQDFILYARDIKLEDIENFLDVKDRDDKKELFRNIPNQIYDKNIPAVITSKSIFGYKMKLYNDLISNKNSSLFDNIIDNDFINPVTKWQIVPGCTNYVKKEIINLSQEYLDIKKYLSEEIFSFCAGRRDLIFPLIRKPVPSNEYIKMLAVFEHMLVKTNLLKSPKTSIGTSNKEHYLNTQNNSYYPIKYNYKIDCPIIDIDDIEQLNNKLKKLRIRKSTSIRLLNMISNYNCGVNDNTTRLNFLELYPFLYSFIQEIIHKWDLIPNSTVEYENKLYSYCHCFESAWKNRYHSSYNFSNIPDFNIDFKGGIQQITSALDSVFKSISKHFNSKNALLAITGDKARNINANYMEIDYLHMYEPSYFWVIATSEAATSFFINENNFEFGDKLFIDADNIEQIFNNKNISQNKLLFYVNTIKFFQYLFRDMISYCFAFFQDKDLFTFWYLNYFLTNSETKDIVTRINFLIRFEIICRYINNHKDKTIYNKYIKAGFLFANEVSGVEKFVDDLFKTKGFTKWYEKAFAIASSYSVVIHNDKNIETDIIDIQEAIKRGEVVPYENHSKKNSIEFLQKLFYAYLLMLKNNFNENKLFVSRDLNGHIFKTEQDKKCSFEFDERGGFILFSGKARRIHFKHRNSIMMSLLNHSLISKNKYARYD